MGGRRAACGLVATGGADGTAATAGMGDKERDTCGVVVAGADGTDGAAGMGDTERDTETERRCAKVSRKECPDRILATDGERTGGDSDPFSDASD